MLKKKPLRPKMGAKKSRRAGSIRMDCIFVRLRRLRAPSCAFHLSVACLALDVFSFGAIGAAWVASFTLIVQNDYSLPDSHLLLSPPFRLNWKEYAFCRPLWAIIAAHTTSNCCLWFLSLWVSIILFFRGALYPNHITFARSFPRFCTNGTVSRERTWE